MSLGDRTTVNRTLAKRSIKFRLMKTKVTEGNALGLCDELWAVVIQIWPQKRPWWLELCGLQGLCGGRSYDDLRGCRLVTGARKN